MGNTSYTAHISNKKSAITSKSKLLGVAKHNLRKYKPDDYSKEYYSKETIQWEIKAHNRTGTVEQMLSLIHI